MNQRTNLERVARWLGRGLLTLVVLVGLAVAVGCGTVAVTAEREGRCTMRREAPFEVRCYSDGREVLVWTGPMTLVVEEKKR